MSDTTGWSRAESGFWHKEIHGTNVWISKDKKGVWWMMVGSLCAVATRPTLRECQILAHDTARLWAGEEE